jgi:hypothetical protein
LRQRRLNQRHGAAGGAGALAIEVRGRRGQDDDRDRRGARVAVELLAQLETVPGPQPVAGCDDVRARGDRKIEGGAAVCRHGHAPAGPREKFLIHLARVA